MPANKPTQAPKADMSLLVKQLNETRAKVGLPPVSSALPEWKRWVEAVAEYDTKGLRDVVNQNGYLIDQIEGKTDKNADDLLELAKRVAVLEDAPNVPFPGSG